MRRLALVLAAMLALANCSDSHHSSAALSRSVGPGLGTVTSVSLTGPGGIGPDDHLDDGAVASDGALYLAVTDGGGHHRVVVFRPGEGPRELANESSVPGLAPTALAVDSTSRALYVASGDGVVLLADDNPGQRGPVGPQVVFYRRDATPSPKPNTRVAFPGLGPPRYMAFDRGTHDLYLADLTQVVRFNARAAEAAVATVGHVSGLAVDERTGDVYVGDRDQLVRVGPDSKPTGVRATEKDGSGKDKEPRDRFDLGDGKALAVDATGGLLVPLDSQVLRVRPDGAAAWVPGVVEAPPAGHSGRPPSPFTTLDQENWIALDGAGNLYLAARSITPDRRQAPVRIRKVTSASPF